MKKLISLIFILTLIAGCNNSVDDSVNNNDVVSDFENGMRVDEGISPNIISIGNNIYVLYVKEGDIYAKKYYNDLREIGSPVKLTKNTQTAGYGVESKEGIVYIV